MEKLDHTLKDFKSELDSKNQMALKELNRQIDELATIPLRNLDPYMDSIDYLASAEGEGRSFHQLPDSNISLQLEQDLKSFKELANQPVNASLMESTLELFKNSFGSKGSPSKSIDQTDAQMGLSAETLQLLNSLEKRDLLDKDGIYQLKQSSIEPSSTPKLPAGIPNEGMKSEISTALSKQTRDLLDSMIQVRNNNPILQDANSNLNSINVTKSPIALSKESQDLLKSIVSARNDGANEPVNRKTDASPENLKINKRDSSTRIEMKSSPLPLDNNRRASTTSDAIISKETMALLEELKHSQNETKTTPILGMNESTSDLLGHLRKGSELFSPEENAAKTSPVKVYQPINWDDEPALFGKHYKDSTGYMKDKIDEARKSIVKDFAPELLSGVTNIPDEKHEDNSRGNS
jgi:hypothetical protein